MAVDRAAKIITIPIVVAVQHKVMQVAVLQLVYQMLEEEVADRTVAPAPKVTLLKVEMVDPVLIVL
jgi:hypothetical protein